MEKFFSKFPTFIYRDKNAIDITRRITITPKDKNNPYNYYPFLLQEEIRSDQTADFYYNDPELDWLVYHVNGIIDPYYDWYNTNEQFDQLVIEKYGSLENAKKKIWLYVNNWATDEVQLTPSTYDNQIPNSWKKYYNPVWGPKAEIISYERKKVDWFQNTNRILNYSVGFVSGNSFTVGEIADLKYSGEIVGTGEVEFSNSTIVSIKSISGNTVANSSVVINIIGETSGSNATSNSVVTLHETIPLSEEVFWSPIYYYEYELEKNESRKHINLINDQLTPFIIQDFESKLQE